MNELSIFNSIFDAMYNSPTICKTNTTIPLVDLKSTKNSYTIEMDLPGSIEKNLKIQLEKNTLTISSENETVNDEKNDDNLTWLIRERKCSSFSRSFTLPDDIDSERINATLKNGVLNITIPRKELPTPKLISIQAA